MKKIVLFIICLAFMACNTTKKSLNTSEKGSLEAVKQEASQDDSRKTVDTTRTDKKKITITEIEFYPPSGPEIEEPNVGDKIDPSKIPKKGTKNAIKSIKQTTIESELEEKGKSEESHSSNIEKSEANISNNEKKVQQEAAPAPDPYKWRYIFYIMLLAIGILLYLKKTPIISWIKKILFMFSK